MLKSRQLFSFGSVLVVGLLVLFLSGCNDDDSGEESDVKPVQPEEVADVFLEGEYERLYDQTSQAFQSDVSLKQLQDIGNDFNQGVSAYLFQSKVPVDQDITQYTWMDEESAKGVVATFEEDHTIIGFQVVPLHIYPDTDEQFTETSFRFPFEKEFFVLWGGTNQLINYHYEHENQRYAFDLLMMQENATYDGDPVKNESYYAFGEHVVAPADGEIVKMENELEDNEPVGEMDAENPLGNYVIIDHGHDEYSYLAHFKQNSIEVKEGDHVKAGDLLGLVGNSGNSSEPHIHFHVADSPDFEDSKSIRINFKNKDPIQGDVVEPGS